MRGLKAVVGALVIMLGLYIVIACTKEDLVAPVQASVTATTDDYLLASGFQDSSGADVTYWSDNSATCAVTYVGGNLYAPGCFRGVPARYRWQCLPSSTWSNWKLIPVGSFNGRSSKISCALGGTGLHVQMELNDSIGSSASGTVVVDTGAYTTRARVTKDFTLDKATWANGPRDTIYWANWYAVPYTQLVAIVPRAKASFGYSLPKTPVHVNNHEVDCCEMNTANYDSVYLSPPAQLGGRAYWDYQSVNVMWHEFGHHFMYRALHQNTFDWHGPPDATEHMSEIGEAWAEFFGGWAAAFQQYAHGQSGLTPEYVDPHQPFNNAPDDWDMERDSLRALAYDLDWGWDRIPEGYLGGFLNDLVDQVSDTNGYHNTVGSGLNADDDSASNWGAKYLADALTGNYNGGTAKCVITWPAGGSGGVHQGPQHVQDLIMCLEHSTQVQLAVPTRFRQYWRDDAISVTETITEPAGWSASKVRQLWRLALYNSGLRYFKFNTGSGWKCLTSVGDSVYWTGISGGPAGYAYRFGGVGGTNGSNSWIGADASGAATHYVNDPSFGSQFAVSFGDSGAIYPGIKFDSVGVAGTWFSFLYLGQHTPFSEQSVDALPADLQGTAQFSVGGTCP